MAKRERFQTPLGMHDILPHDQPLWRRMQHSAELIVEFYGFERIDTPILEFTDLFRKGTGEDTDIVQKEMFSLKTRGGGELTLRPEGTPPVVRAYLQHGMEKWISPVKLYYWGPMFRHEKPQRGRFRQLHQLGVEIIGEDDPARDVQVIQAFFVILEKIKIKDVRLEVNSIGCSKCRGKYQKVLKDYYRNRLKQVCVDCRARYRATPLRLLDCDDEKCQRVKIQAPQILDHLCDECHSHFREVLELLDALSIPYFLNPYLVRGLDYYTRTVFEIFEGGADAEIEERGSKRLAIASGGRYDNLVKLLGGTDTPAVGGAIGVERTLTLLKGQRKAAISYVVPQARVFLVQLGDKAKKQALLMLEDFRKEGIPLREAFGHESITAQLKIANKMGADLTIILGQKEVLDKVVIIREMDTGVQETIPADKLMKEIKKRLKKKEKK